MTIQPLQALAFQVLTDSKSLSEDQQNTLLGQLEVGETAPLDSLIVLQEKYPEKLGGVIKKLLSSPMYTQSCVNLTNIKKLDTYVCRLSNDENTDDNFRPEIDSLKTILTNNLDKFSNIDLVTIACDSNHELSDFAKKMLSDKLKNGILEGGIKIYAERGCPTYDDGQLLETVTDKIDSSYKNIAKQSLLARLENGSFQMGILAADRLIPIVGEPAISYIETNIQDLEDGDELVRLARNNQHPLSNLFKQELDSRLQNDTFYGNIKNAKSVLET